MKTTELIEMLVKSVRNHGDLDVFTNGEHGAGEVEPLTDCSLSIGSAGLFFDTDYLDVDDSDIVVHIGGS